MKYLPCLSILEKLIEKFLKGTTIFVEDPADEAAAVYSIALAVKEYPVQSI